MIQRVFTEFQRMLSSMIISRSY